MTYRGLALSGRAGSGKSTLARLLVCELQAVGIDAEIVSFGGALKQEVYGLFGLTKDDPGGRDKLVAYGEEKRNEDPLYWVERFADCARAAWADGHVVVCDDLRFLSELGWCHASGMETCRLEVPAHICASRIAQPPDPLSPGECELIPWSGWTHRYDDWDGSLKLGAVARQLSAHVREIVLNRPLPSPAGEKREALASNAAAVNPGWRACRELPSCGLHDGHDGRCIHVGIDFPA